jgi:hypothetical protein
MGVSDVCAPLRRQEVSQLFWLVGGQLAGEVLTNIGRGCSVDRLHVCAGESKRERERREKPQLVKASTVPFSMAR